VQYVAIPYRNVYSMDSFVLFDSWKSTTLMNDAEQVEKCLKEIVQKHFKDGSESNWSDISLADTNVKFNVIKDAIVETGKDVPNAELNNIKTVSDALEFFSRKAVALEDKRGAVQRFFEDDIEELPSNIAFQKQAKYGIES
jgi:hypothetical protein